MKIKTSIKYIIAIFIFFTSIIFVSAFSITDENSPGYNAAGSGAALAGEPTKWPTPYLRVIRVRLIRNGGDIAGGYYTLANTSDKCYGSVETSKVCLTSTYNNAATSSCVDQSAVYFNGCLVKSDMSSVWEVKKYDGTILHNHLSTNSYAELVSIIKGLGYNETNLEEGDIVIVEPAVNVMCNKSSYFGTVNALKYKNVDYSGRGSLCGTGTFNGYTFQYLYNSMSSALQTTAATGYFKYNISDMFTIIKKGTLEVVKKNNLGNPVSGAKFTIYSGSGCNTSITTITTNSEGIATYELDEGNYSVEETGKASEYYEDPDGTCVNFSITAGNKTTKSFTNELKCQYYLDEIEDNYTGDDRKEQLIKLYEGTYHQKQGNFSNYKKLLDFNDPECSPNVSCSPSNNSRCLYTSKNIETSFGENNLSCYNEKVQMGTTNIYCVTSFDFNNKLNGIKDFRGISGRRIRELSENDVLATATLKKTCYGFGITSSETNYINYSNYIGDIKFNKKNLINDYDGEDVSLVKSGNKYEAVISVNYSLPPVYVKKGTGEIVGSPCSTCINLGNIFLSKFTYKSDEFQNNKIILPFSIKFNNSIFSDVNVIDENNACTFTPDYELIEDDKIQLEFRTIDTNNPFSGKFGTTRKVGSNWCDSTGNCSGDSSNMYVNMVINSNNSRNKTKQGAKYVIKLTSSDIKNIREYNKTHTYDDYDFTCINNGETCISNYLTKLRNDGIITTIINNKRACIENNDC